jgi:hypothetical protein
MVWENTPGASPAPARGDRIPPGGAPSTLSLDPERSMRLHPFLRFIDLLWPARPRNLPGEHELESDRCIRRTPLYRHPAPSGAATTEPDSAQDVPYPWESHEAASGDWSPISAIEAQADWDFAEIRLPIEINSPDPATFLADRSSRWPVASVPPQETRRLLAVDLAIAEIAERHLWN